MTFLAEGRERVEYRQEGTLGSYLCLPVTLHFRRISFFHSFDGSLLSCPLNTLYESNENQESLNQGQLGIKRAKHIYVCPFSGIFDISPVYSNPLRLTALDIRLNTNHSTLPCMNFE